MALREGLPSNMSYADGSSTMRNFIVVVAWHGESPKVSTSCTDPRGSTFSPENPSKWAFTDSSFSLSMPIFSNADAKMMSVELPLSIRTLCTVLLATMALVVIMGMLAAFHVGVRESYGGIQSRELGHGLYLQCLPLSDVA